MLVASIFKAGASGANGSKTEYEAA